LEEEPSAWALFDSTPSFKQPPDDFLTSKNFVVQTPPPRTDRMEWQSKFPPVFVFCLDLWTPTELICAYVTTFIMNITLIHSTVHRFNGVALANRLLLSSVRSMDIQCETLMHMWHQQLMHSKWAFGLTVVISVMRKLPRSFPMFRYFTSR
jgi:hypothetical protein